MDNRLVMINTASSFIRSKINGFVPEVGIILGSGLGELADNIENPIVIAYGNVPGFPLSTAIGHKGNFIFGTLGGRRIVAMQGRFHYYEGYTMEMASCMPIRVMKSLGIEYLFVSNAAGGTNPAFEVGDLMAITDHINLLPNPLIGKNLDEFGPRFPDMTAAYDKAIVALADEVARENGITLRHGVYLASSGPTYETPAEIRFFAAAGADAVGMSTVPEVIVARHCGLKVFGISVISNKANFDTESTFVNDGQDVVDVADKASKKMTALITGILSKLK